MSDKNAVQAAAKSPVPRVGVDHDLLDELMADAGVGTQMGMQDLALPYVYILQPLSPQVDRESSGYVEGAIPGMFYNHVTGQVFEGKETGLMFIPCAYERKFVEWVPRDKGGGWVADYEVDSGIEKSAKLVADSSGKSRLMLGDHLLVETAYQYGLLMHPETDVWEQCCLPLKSTGLRANRKLNNLIRGAMIPGTDRVAPRFAFSYQLTSYKEEKNNNRWYSLDVSRLPDINSPAIYWAAKSFHTMVTEGTIKRAAEQPVDATVIDEIPF